MAATNFRTEDLLQLFQHIDNNPLFQGLGRALLMLVEDAERGRNRPQPVDEDALLSVTEVRKMFGGADMKTIRRWAEQKEVELVAVINDKKRNALFARGDVLKLQAAMANPDGFPL